MTLKETLLSPQQADSDKGVAVGEKDCGRNGRRSCPAAGSGPGGRIVREDVVAAAQTPSPKKPAVPQPLIDKPPTAYRPQPKTKRYLCPACGKPSPHACWRARRQSRIFISRLKSTPNRSMSLRQLINPAAEAAGLGKLTVNDFILKATAVAATRVPLANATFNGDSIIQFANVQLACAVAVDEGLVTPVIREAQKKLSLR